MVTKQTMPSNRTAGHPAGQGHKRRSTPLRYVSKQPNPPTNTPKRQTATHGAYQRYEVRGAQHSTQRTTTHSTRKKVLKAPQAAQQSNTAPHSWTGDGTTRHTTKENNTAQKKHDSTGPHKQAQQGKAPQQGAAKHDTKPNNTDQHNTTRHPKKQHTAQQHAPARGTTSSLAPRQTTRHKHASKAQQSATHNAPQSAAPKTGHTAHHNNKRSAGGRGGRTHGRTGQRQHSTTPRRTAQNRQTTTATQILDESQHTTTHTAQRPRQPRGERRKAQARGAREKKDTQKTSRHKQKACKAAPRLEAPRAGTTNESKPTWVQRMRGKPTKKHAPHTHKAGATSARRGPSKQRAQPARPQVR